MFEYHVVGLSYSFLCKHLYSIKIQLSLLYIAPFTSHSVVSIVVKCVWSSFIPVTQMETELV